MLNRGSCQIRLGKARQVLEVFSRRPDLAELFGQDAEALARGWALYDQARTAHYQRLNQLGDAQKAMARCTARFRAARAAQGRLTALARVMITVPSDRDRLGIAGRRAEAIGSWRLQTEVFHANLTPEDRTLLARVGVKEAELQHVAHLLTTLAEEHAACIAAKAAARKATATKTKAFQELASYLSVVTAVARALEPDHPQVISLLPMTPDGRRRGGTAVGNSEPTTQKVISQGTKFQPVTAQNDVDTGEWVTSFTKSGGGIQKPSKPASPKKGSDKKHRTRSKQTKHRRRRSSTRSL